LIRPLSEDLGPTDEGSPGELEGIGRSVAALEKELQAAKELALEREAVAREVAAERDELSRAFAATVTAARVAETAAAAIVDELRSESASLRSACDEARAARDALATRLAEAQELAYASEAAAAEAALERDRLAWELAEARDRLAWEQTEARAAADEAERTIRSHEEAISWLTAERAGLAGELAEAVAHGESLHVAGRHAEAASEALAAQLDELTRTNVAREAAVAQSLAELRQAFVIQERELTRIADERLQAVARARTEAVAAARNAEWLLAEAFDRSRLERTLPSARERAAESAAEQLLGLVGASAAAAASARTAEQLAVAAFEEQRHENHMLSAAQREAEGARAALAVRLAEAERVVAERDRALAAARVAHWHLAEALEELRLEAAVHQVARRRAEASALAHERERVRVAEQGAYALADARIAEWRVADALQDSQLETRSLREAENQHRALATRLAEEQALAQTERDALALRFAELETLAQSERDALALRLAEAQDSAQTERDALALRLAEAQALAQSERDALADARIAEWRAAETLEQARLKNSLLAAAELVSGSAAAGAQRELGELARKLGEVVRELGEVARERDHALASGRVAEWRAADAFELLRVENATLLAQHRRNQAALEGLALRLAEIDALARDPVRVIRHNWKSLPRMLLARVKRRIGRRLARRAGAP